MAQKVFTKRVDGSGLGKQTADASRLLSDDGRTPPYKGHGAPSCDKVSARADLLTTTMRRGPPIVRDKMPRKDGSENEIDEAPSQRKRPESARYLLQVGRQTKGSYLTSEAAQSAALVIKKGYPVVEVSV